MNDIVRVNFKQVYDLVFRARNAKLNSVAYVLDFRDWIKAGVAFNTRGFQLSTRKISYFAQLYELLQKGQREGTEVLLQQKSVLSEALTYYYEDIYEIYQDHVRSKHAEAIQHRSRDVPNFGDLLVLPCFDGFPQVEEVFEKRIIPWDSYECKLKDDFAVDIASTYLKPDSPLARCMSLMFDYGRGRVEEGVILEVKLWDS